MISAAARNNVPAVYWLSDFVAQGGEPYAGIPLARICGDGGLLSYGPDLADNWHRAATYVDRILRGAKADDLPVQLITTLVSALLISLFSLFVAATPAAAQQQQRPNIVVIWGDDIGQSNVSAYSRGMMGYQTPNIDRVPPENHIRA